MEPGTVPEFCLPAVMKLTMMLAPTLARSNKALSPDHSTSFKYIRMEQHENQAGGVE